MVLDSYGLGPERSFNEISYEQFHEVLKLYTPTLLTTDTYENFEDIRLKTLPETLRQRQTAGCAFMEKVELQILGEYRRTRKQPPGLLIKQMARSLAANTVEAVRDTTREAFILYGERRNYRDAIDKLMKLEGVSFSIASLILNTYDPVNLPYFTESLYRWVREDDARAGTWDRKIDYIFKNFRVLLERVAQIRGRLKHESGMDITALEIEQVARQLTEWALVRRKRRPKADDDEYMLKPLDKVQHSRLSLPKYVQEQQAASRQLESQFDSDSLSPNQALPGVPPAMAMPSPPSPPRQQPPWLGHPRTSCDTCRKLKRRCTHKDGEEAPPPKKMGRPRKNLQETPHPQNGPSRSQAIGLNLPETYPGSAVNPLTLPDHHNNMPASSTINAPGVAIAPAPHRPVFPLPDPNAAIRDALVTWQRQN